MQYEGQKYNWVNEKEVDGILYQCFRCEGNPRKTILVKDGEVKEVKDIRKEWGKING